MHFILEIYIWIVFVWRVMQISSSIVSASKKNCVLRAKPKILYEFWRVMQISSSIVLASKKKLCFSIQSQAQDFVKLFIKPEN
jgi:hypothetical protein